MESVTTDNITISYGKTPIVGPLSLTLKSGSTTALTGASGSGKTTLLRTLAGLYQPSSGTVNICGEQLHTLPQQKRATLLGYVAQQYHLFPHLTVLANCTLALKQVMGLKKEEATARVLQLLDHLHITHLADKYPCQLSGGQQQRVAIARALALQPQVLLLDEPTAALDPANCARLAEILKTLKADGVTVILSTHDHTWADQVADNVICLDS